MGRRWSCGWQVVYKLEQQDQGSGPCQELSRGEEERNGSVSLVREQTLGIQDLQVTGKGVSQGHGGAIREEPPKSSCLQALCPCPHSPSPASKPATPLELPCQ